MFVRKTNSRNLARGIILLIFALTLSYIFDLTMMKFLLRRAMELGLIAIVILFQPELRRGLERMGRGGIFGRSGQLDKSKVSLVNKKDHAIICHFEEWMTFRSSLLSLDRTRFIYTLVAESSDNKVKVKIFRISYWYNELQDGGEHFQAEEWITDKWALNKKKTRLAKRSGKFRRKTVDRVETIFDNIQTILNIQ